MLPQQSRSPSLQQMLGLTCRQCEGALRMTLHRRGMSWAACDLSPSRGLCAAASTTCALHSSMYDGVWLDNYFTGS